MKSVTSLFDSSLEQLSPWLRLGIMEVHMQQARLTTNRQCPGCWQDVHSRQDQEPANFCPYCQFPLKRVGGVYQLEGKLGAGAFGTVYKARHTETRGLRAIKVMRWDTAFVNAPKDWSQPQRRKKQQEFQERFQREVRLTSTLSERCWHIVHIDGAGADEVLGLYYIMEYLEGAPLRHLMAQWPSLAQKTAFSIMEQVCHGVAVAHRSGIIHRDLKPDNIFLLKQDAMGRSVKILDFGLAKGLKEEGAQLTTRPMGTPLYMPPEQCLNAEIDQRADIYSLGAIMFHLLTGTPPYNETKDTSRLLFHHLQAPPPSIRRRRPDLCFPEALDQIIQRAMAKQKDDRFANVEAFWDALVPLQDWASHQPKEWMSGLTEMDMSAPSKGLGPASAHRLQAQPAKKQTADFARSASMKQVEEDVAFPNTTLEDSAGPSHPWFEAEELEAASEVGQEPEAPGPEEPWIAQEQDEGWSIGRDVVLDDEDWSPDWPRRRSVWRKPGLWMTATAALLIGLYWMPPQVLKGPLQELGLLAPSQLTTKIAPPSKRKQASLRQAPKPAKRAVALTVAPKEPKKSRLRRFFQKAKAQRAKRQAAKRHPPSRSTLARRASARQVGRLKRARQAGAWVRAIRLRGVSMWPGAQSARVPAGWLSRGAGPASLASMPDTPISPRSRNRLLQSIWMWRTEVTQSQFRALMGYNPAHFRSCGNKCPIENVSWHEAAAFTNALSRRQGRPTCYVCWGKGASTRCRVKAAYKGRRYYSCKGWRLPTEAEWEHAYKAGSSNPFPTGSCLTSRQANFNGQDASPRCDKGKMRKRTLPVASFRPNRWGFHDMAGNVWEWVYDGAGPAPAKQRSNPIRGASSRRIVKGGGWYSAASECRADARESFVPSKRSLILGFRPVRNQ